MSSMYIVRPMTVTDAILYATDVPETDYSAWNSGTAYATGDRVILVSTHKIYQSLQNANTNHNPATEATWWSEVEPTNAWKLFDNSNSTQTVQADSMSYTLQSGQVINTVAALNVSANSIRVRMIDSIEGEVYDTTTVLTDGLPNPNWYEYFFADIPRRDYLVLTDLPAYASAQVVIDFAHSTGVDCECGVLILGYKSPFGMGVEHGAKVGIIDYSRKEVDDWGNTVLTQRAFSRRAEFSMLIATDEIDTALSMLTAIRATPCLFIGSEDYGSLIIFGFYKDFDIGIAYPTAAECTLQIEGLT